MEKKLGTERQQVDVIKEGIERPLHEQVLHVGKIKNSDATPNVLDVNTWQCGTTVVTITDFKNGQNGQTIKVLGHANTTISHNANIKTNTGANKVLAADKVYTFTRINNVWYEDE